MRVVTHYTGRNATVPYLYQTNNQNKPPFLATFPLTVPRWFQRGLGFKKKKKLHEQTVLSNLRKNFQIQESTKSEKMCFLSLKKENWKANCIHTVNLRPFTAELKIYYYFSQNQVEFQLLKMIKSRNKREKERERGMNNHAEQTMKRNVNFHEAPQHVSDVIRILLEQTESP